jgi:hypothetical protein
LNREELLVYWILEQVPESLCRAYIPSLEVLGNLIVRSRDGNGRTIRPFIDILIDILDCLYRYTNLDVNMQAELLEEVRVIRNDLAVIADDFLAWKAWFTDRKHTAVIPVPVLGIPILADNYYGCKRLGEPLLVRKRGCRYITDYIQGFRIIIKAIRPVRHLASNYGRKFACRIL